MPSSSNPMNGSQNPRSTTTKPQLEEWRKKKESHEQVGMGQRVQRPSQQQMKEQLEKTQRGIEGRRE
ncbi:hypothetical protein ACLMJK_002209 [Lecanora helva]